MASALLDQVGIDIADPSAKIRLHATGSTIVFDGFLALYQEDRDDAVEDEDNRRLPPMREKEPLGRGPVTPSQHFTQPPPRYTEASLVKKLEELGIGRPSTYASIIQVLQDRDYVRLDKRRFVPEDRGRLVTAFLTSFFERYVEYNFTADLENQLDDISGGRIDWKEVLRNFWRDFSGAIDGTKDLTIGQVLTALDEELGRHFFPDDGSGRDARRCPACEAGRLALKLGRFGAFIACSNYPACRYTRALGIESEEDGKAAATPDTALGTDPASGQPVALKKGPYGQYIQLGNGENSDKPKRVALPKGMAPQDINLDIALKLLALPREIGRHPNTGEPITAGIGRFGPYLKYGTAYTSLGADDDVLNIGLNRAVTLIAEAKSGGGRRGPQLLRELGPHPEGGIVGLYRGRYGPYVGHDGLIASLPRGADPETFSFDAALPLLAAQKAKGKKARGQNTRGQKTKGQKTKGQTGRNARPASAAPPPATAAAKKPARATAVEKPTRPAAKRPAARAAASTSSKTSSRRPASR
jgi:DNA topoisomerase-1